MIASLALVCLLSAAPQASPSRPVTLPDRFADWQAESTGESALEGLDARILASCRSAPPAQKTYRRGSETLSVAVYALPDSSYAYSAYSFLRPMPEAAVRPVPHSSVTANQALLLVGNLLVSVRGQNLPARAADLKELASALAHQADRTPYPRLWQYLPAEHLVAYSDRYILAPELLAPFFPQISGDWVGFSDSAEVELGQYRVGRQVLTLILILYPTQQLAALHTGELGHWFAVNPDHASGAKPVLYLRRQGPLVAAVTGARTRSEAEKVLGRVVYETTVTWNEPAWAFRDLTMAQYVLGTILGTGLLLGLCLLGGLLLALTRLAIKRAFPGRVFDRTASVEILQLGLTSKPIDARDFYRY
jgi:hypothetical protein